MLTMVWTISSSDTSFWFLYTMFDEQGGRRAGAVVLTLVVSEEQCRGVTLTCFF